MMEVRESVVELSTYRITCVQVFPTKYFSAVPDSTSKNTYVDNQGTPDLLGLILQSPSLENGDVFPTQADLAASRLLERQQREQAKELHEQLLKAAGQYVPCTGLPTCMCYDCVMDREDERIKTQQRKESLATLAIENELEHVSTVHDDWDDDVPPENVSCF